jgi:phage/plasmid-like protein (TIGR03299 family)
MAHDLEQRDGRVTFALRGKPAWHGLTNHTFEEDEHVSTKAMLDSSLLSNWNVRLEDIALPETYTWENPNLLVVRDNPFDPAEKNVLATVGSRYQVLQNESLFDFGDNLLDGGGYWESAGSVRNGRTVFGSLRLPQADILIDGKGIADKTEMYLLVTTSHDGSSAVQALVTPVRVVCSNTLNMALRGNKQSFKIRHTQTISGRMEQAREALGITFAYADAFQQEAQAMFESEITKAQFDSLVSTLYPMPEKGSAPVAFTKHANKIDLIQDIYASDKQDGIRGTAWGAYNALTERIDWFRGIRNNDSEASLISASGMDATTTNEKREILRAVKDLVMS